MKRQISTGNQITEGVIWKQLLFFFFPILLGTFFQQFYNTIDMVIVGRFVGKEALASVGGSAGQITNLVIGFFTGLSTGAGVIVSQYYGARDTKTLNDSLHTAYAFSIAGGVFFMILGILCSPVLLRWMNTSPELIASSEVYLRIYFAGIVFIFIYNIGSGILRATGDSRRPLYYLIICCFLNIILDLVMVMGFHLGIAGAAAATVLAQAVSAVLVTSALMRSSDIYQLQLKKIRIHRRVLKSQLYLGLPGGFQSVMYSLSNIIIQAAINVFGTDTTAAWAAYGKLDAVFWMINSAFGMSITTFVGQNYGAGRRDRIRKSTRICLVMDLCSSVFMCTFLILFRVPLFRIFTDDPNVVQIGAYMLKLITPTYVIFVFIEILSGSLRGISDVMIPTFLTLFGTCLLRVAWMFIAVPKNPCIEMIIAAYPLTWTVTAMMFIIYYHYKMKRFGNR
ncbi:MATE family efflux transporter [Blautia sp. HCP3S3_G3]|uniref:MATE family efflux transporter n=1 Tax=Blautia sp. HCP3S3_G3 TaxID=3438913 RepID=UPI003F88CC38